MPHVQKTSRDSFLCDQKRNKIFTQTKRDTMLSFMTVCTYTQMESIALNLVRNRKMTTVGIGRNVRMMISQKLKVQWSSHEAKRVEGE